MSESSSSAAASRSPVARTGVMRRVLRAARLHRDRWADERELAHSIHGTVVGAAAMAAASLHGTLGEVVVTVLVTVAVYWAAERYAEVLAAAVRGPARGRRSLAALREGVPMIEAAYTPLIVLVVIVLVTGRLQTGVLAALGAATVMLRGWATPPPVGPGRAGPRRSAGAREARCSASS